VATGSIIDKGIWLFGIGVRPVETNVAGVQGAPPEAGQGF